MAKSGRQEGAAGRVQKAWDTHNRASHNPATSGDPKYKAKPGCLRCRDFAEALRSRLSGYEDERGFWD